MSANGTQPAKLPNPPNQTLYVGNLDDKMNKSDLRRALYSLFSTHGSVLDVIALKTSRMRGQAHIVFKDSQTSSQAMRSLQGFEFFGKEMKIAYGKGKSDIVSRLDGTAKVREMPKDDVVMTDAQKSAFGTATATSAALTTKPNGVAEAAGVQTQGTKRRRDEDEVQQQEASAEEDEEDDAMDVSDED
ncbi:MAG: U2 snRNP complex subunit msl1 [Chrysothrix sp. TS-e1954]|nr:MAG: U2 snRNP complex subunit msl1 [Chrysothrix sp. TS-e1954]